MSRSRSSKERGYIFNTFLQAKKKFESLFHRSLLYKLYGLIFWFHCWLWSLRSYCFSELLELWPCFNACVYILTYLLTESDAANNEHEICKYCCALISFCHGLRYVTLRNTISAVRKSNKIANFKAKSSHASALTRRIDIHPSRCGIRPFTQYAVGAALWLQCSRKCGKTLPFQ